MEFSVTTDPMLDVNLTRSTTYAIRLRLLHLFGTALVMLVVFAAQASAATYYVSPSGNDANSCAQARNASTARLTISAGVTCLVAGDTLYLRAGTYTGSSNVIDSARFVVPSGTSWSSPITIAGQPGESVVLQPPDNINPIRLTVGAPSYLIFQDFTIDMVNDRVGGTNPEGAYVGSGAHHNRFLRLEIKNAKGFGVVFSNTIANSPFNEVVNCNIHSTGDGSGNPLNGHGIYAFTSDNLFEGNYIHDNQGAGIDLYNNTGPKSVSRNVVRKNRVYGNGKSDTGGSEYGIIVAWGDDNLVYNNLVYNNEGGILVYTSSANAKLYNNTVYRNDNEGIAMQYFASAPIVRNNIVYSNGSGIVTYSGTGSPVLSNNLTNNPSFVNSAGGDFRLQSSSAAKDTGFTLPEVAVDFDGAVRPQGNSHDVGAYEFAVTGPAPAPKPPRNVRVKGQG